MSRRLPLLSLFAADAISVTGNVLAMVAIPWFVLETTDSAAMTGLVAFFTAAATVVASFFGGTLVDRVGYRTASVVSDIASGFSIAAIPVVFVLAGNRIEIWVLIAFVFLGALLDAPGTAARTSLLPDVAEISGTSLERVTGLSQAIRRGATMLGAPIGGALILLVGTHGVLLIDAVSFGVSAALVWLLIPAPRRPQLEGEALAPTARGSYLADLKDGLRFIWADRLARAIIATIMLTNFLDAPIFAVILPVYVKEIYGSPAQLGILLGVFGAAALAGALLFGAIGARLPRRLTFGLAFVILGVPFWILALTPPFWLAVAGSVLAGIAAGPINPILHTVIFERVPADMRGRVIGPMTAGAWVAMPLGMLVAGFVSEEFGVVAALVGIAAAYMVVTASIFLNPVMRQMDRRPAEEPGVAEA
jgi:MFS family permease